MFKGLQYFIHHTAQVGLQGERGEGLLTFSIGEVSPTLLIIFS